ncbi:hypothetical protein R3P38DRAFT_2775180 [Favolaschia claudopus]|uniref:Uncharacterized protein n=1 Tax=Favolaschia claudopus TaxID=2862362 RepID=A0AAW0BSV2_9AGAR
MELYYLHRQSQHGLKLDSDPTKPPTMHSADWGSSFIAQAGEIMGLYPYWSLDKVAGKLDCQTRVTADSPESASVPASTSGPVTQSTYTIHHQPLRKGELRVYRSASRDPFTVVPPPAAFPAPTIGLRKQRNDSKSQRDKENQKL